jgi:predicted MPP superfamily phosphohydrolase
MIFAGSVLLFYYCYVRLWLTWLIRKFRKKETGKILTGRTAVVLHIVAGIGFCCIFYGYFVEPYWVQVNTIPITTNKLQHTHFRVVQISDLHCDRKIRLERQLPDIINSLKPDIIVFTGDSLNRASSLGTLHETLAKMDAPLGKFAVTGNCDYVYCSDIDLFGGTGFEELRLHKRRIEKDGESIVIAGLAYENGRISQKVVGQLEEPDFNLFLYHNSELMDYFSDKNIDLYLCGHTHGGQVALPFYGALITLSRHGKKYEAGLYTEGGLQLYVNRGIGLEGGGAPKVRFCARPEIAVFDIGPAMPQNGAEEDG